MPYMYLAKVNLSSKIFDVYENKLSIAKVLNVVYRDMNDKNTYTYTQTKKFTDSLGNIKEYQKKSRYQFNELMKNDENMTITGKIVRTYSRPIEEFNDDGEIINSYEDAHVSIYFFFDVRKELVAFSMRQSFGYNQFIEAFKKLLNLCISEYDFEVFLKKDQNVLSEKLKALKTVNRVSATLIPPNSNEEELKEFRETLGYIYECKETNAKKIKLDLIDTDDVGLNMEAKMMRDTIKAAVKGYGDITTYGVNFNGREEVVKSNTDAALTRVINENLSESDYNDEAASFMAAVIATSLAH